MPIVLSRKGGGGGSGAGLPDWWTVDSTPGNENVLMEGRVEIELSDVAGLNQKTFYVHGVGFPTWNYSFVTTDLGGGSFNTAFDANGVGSGDSRLDFTDETGGHILFGTQSGLQFEAPDFPPYADGNILFSLYDSLGNAAIEVRNTDGVGTSRFGFFGATTVVQQTGVPVTAQGVHDALVAYGLITA